MPVRPFCLLQRRSGYGRGDGPVSGDDAPAGTQQYLDLFAAMGDEDLDNALAASEKNKDTVMQSALNSWKSVKGDLGALVSSEAAEVEIVDDGYVPGSRRYLKKETQTFL